MSMSDHHRPSSSFSPWASHQVFLCFRGTDVRRGFLQCFKDALDRSGIDAFMDSDDILSGEVIHPKIFHAIRHAQVCVPIFSQDFASSTSCLMEVSYMVKLNKNILPIFYGLEPSVVRHHLGTYEASFCKHAERGTTGVGEWKKALVAVSDIRGEILLDVENDSHKLLEKVIDRLWELLRMDYQDEPRHLVGVSHHVLQILTKLDVECEDGQVMLGQRLRGKRVVAISGLPGIGKSTLAKVVYNRLRPLFQRGGSCFLGGIRGKIRERMLLSLQEKLIHDLQGRSCSKLRSSDEGIQFIRGKFKDKEVFLVLDDVEDFDFIERSMGGLDWLGPGSRILVTTRNRDIIKHFEAKDRLVLDYEIGPMPLDKARELFYKHAFRSDPPDEDFASFAAEITNLLGGNPYSITLVASALHGNDKSEWKGLWTEMGEKLKDKPEENIERLLKLTFEKFDPNTRHIFLDIACLFNGMDKRIPSYLWKASKRYPDSGIYPLCNVSWLKVGANNELLMPKQIEILGKKIVRDEDPDNPRKRSRVWDHEDASRALKKVKAQNSNKVEALCLGYNRLSYGCFSYRKLSFLSALRFLRLCFAKPDGCSKKRVLPKLGWLVWEGCREVSHLRSFHVEDLVVLDLSASERSFTAFPAREWELFLQEAKKLKVLNLSGHLQVSLNFPPSTNLERLILEHCFLPLPRSNCSVGNLQKLISLNLKYCKMVRGLPGNLGEMKALTELLIDGTDIENIVLPNDLMNQLEFLSAGDCKKLACIPEFLDSSSMRVLSFKGCEQIRYLPDSVGKLRYLKLLDLSETMITQLNPSFDRLENLETLRMRRTNLEEFPEAIQSMKNLREIDFSNTRSMRGEGDVTRLSSLRILKLSSTRVSQLRMSRAIYCNLEIFECDDSINVRILPEP